MLLVTALPASPAVTTANQPLGAQRQSLQGGGVAGQRGQLDSQADRAAS
jgi:hypothetical protein